MAFTCDRCSKCCEEHRVPVSLPDVSRLRASALVSALAPEEFLQLLSPDEVDMVGEPESLALVKEGRRLLVLRHRDSNGCVFLEKGVGCRVHEFRPSACRAYPFDRPDGERGGVGLHPAPQCPEETGLFSVSEEESVLLAAVVRERDAEAREFADWLGTWNREQKVRLRLLRPPRSGADLLQRLDKPSC